MFRISTFLASFGRSQRFMDMPWPRHDPDPVVERRKRVVAVVALSVLVHALVLLIQLPEHNDANSAMGSPFHQERLTVRLANPAPPAPKAETETPKPPPRPVKPQPKRPPVLAVQTPSPQSPQVAPPPAPTPPTAQQDYARPIDMMSMVNMARARRAAADAAAAQENASASAGEREPTAAERTQANLARNVKALNDPRMGVHAVFQILSKGTRTAQIAVNGATPGINGKWRDILDVDAGNLGDVELAIVRRLIEHMRVRAPPGPILYGSQRLGRDVVLSTLPENQAETEAFLMQDIFPKPR